MFQYVIQGRYVLTIILVACIVGYIVYYVIHWIIDRKKKEAYMKNNAMEQSFVEHVEITTTVIDKGEEVIVVEKTIDEVLPFAIEGNKDILIDDDIIEFGLEMPADSSISEDVSSKKHKVKNIAEGLSRSDILQDKHEKNLQKLKYEAVLCKQRNDLAGYEKKLIEGLILDPTDIDIFRQLADFYFSEGKYTKALSMFRKILVFDPQDHHALWQIGEIYIEQGSYEDAQIFVEKALSLSPDNPKYYISLIDISIAKNELSQALVYLEKIVGLRPRNISYLMALGEMYEKLGRKEDAKMTYFKVLEVDPLHIDVKHILKRF